MADATRSSVLAIVVNHERPEATERCVRSLLASDHRSLRVAIVDNGSRDGSIAALRRTFPELTIIETGENRGYAAALNAGIRLGTRLGVDAFWLLNNDVVVAPDALSQALRAAARVARPGLVASNQSLSPPGSGEGFEGTPYPSATIRGRLRDRHFTCDGRCEGDGVHRADVVTGAALLVRAEAVGTVGPIDERYFHYGEEDAYSERARAAGYVNLLACRSRVAHEQGTTLASSDPQGEYYRLRNLFLLRRAADGWSPLRLLLHPGYVKTIAGTWARLRRDDLSRLAFRSALRHGIRGRSGRVRLPDRRIPAAPRPLRLLVVTHSAGEYGAEQSLLAMLRALPREEVRPLVVLPRRGPLAARLAEHGVRSVVIGNRAWRGRRSGLLAFLARFWSTATAVWRIDRLIRSAGIDVVGSWTLGVTAGAFAARLAGRPHVWYVHELIEGNDSMRGPLPAALWLRLVERHSDVVVSVSEATRGQFPDAARATHVVVPNALPDRRAVASADRAVAPRRSGGRCRVAVIGAVAPHKRTLDAVRAFDVVRRTHPAAQLRVFGDGPEGYREVVRAEADRLGLDGSVRLEGFEPDPAVYLDADLVLAPSHPEAFGLAVLEAMSAGIPVVAAHSQGLSELVGTDAAVLVAPGDWEAMGREAALLLADDVRYRTIAAAARARARAFTPEGLAARHLEVLRAATARAAGARPAGR